MVDPLLSKEAKEVKESKASKEPHWLPQQLNKESLNQEWQAPKPTNNSRALQAQLWNWMNPNTKDLMILGAVVPAGTTLLELENGNVNSQKKMNQAENEYLIWFLTDKYFTSTYSII